MGHPLAYYKRYFLFYLSGRKLQESQHASADVKVTPVSRYDLSVACGIIHSAEEYNATNLVIGLHWKANIIDSFFGKLTEGVLKGTCKEVMIARKLNALKTKVILLTWNVGPQASTSKLLKEEVGWHIELSNECNVDKTLINKICRTI